jgi:hypothetical protein
LRNHRIALLRHGTNVRRNGKRRDQKYQRGKVKKSKWVPAAFGSRSYRAW